MASSTSGSPNAPGEKNPATDHVGSEETFSVVRRFLAAVFARMITASFVVLPSSLNSLKQSHPTSNIAKDVLHSIQNVPLLAFSCIFCLVGIIGLCTVSWKYAQNPTWLFHEFHSPVAFDGLLGVLSTIANIYTAHGGKYSPSNIATLAAMGSIAVVFGLLALNSYCRMPSHNLKVSSSAP